MRMVKIVRQSDSDRLLMGIIFTIFIHWNLSRMPDYTIISKFGLVPMFFAVARSETVVNHIIDS